MRRARHIQKDLFDDPTPASELRPELRIKLTPLVQALLVEAAGVELRQAKPDPRVEEKGNDQDNA
jgi:hypothetical protein